MITTQLERIHAPVKGREDNRIIRQYADLWNTYLEDFARFCSFQWGCYEAFMDVFPGFFRSEVTFYKNLAEWAVKVEAASGVYAVDFGPRNLRTE